MKIQECLKQKEFKQYSASIQETEINFDPLNYEQFLEVGMTDSNIQFMIFAASSTSNVFEEVLIFDEIGLVGTLGGSLGLFIGFSFLDYITPCVDALIEKVAKFFQPIT